MMGERLADTSTDCLTEMRLSLVLTPRSDSNNAGVAPLVVAWKPAGGPGGESSCAMPMCHSRHAIPLGTPAGMVVAISYLFLASLRLPRGPHVCVRLLTCIASANKTITESDSRSVNHLSQLDLACVKLKPL